MDCYLNPIRQIRSLYLLLKIHWEVHIPGTSGNLAKNQPELLYFSELLGCPISISAFITIANYNFSCCLHNNYTISISIHEIILIGKSKYIIYYKTLRHRARHGGSPSNPRSQEDGDLVSKTTKQQQYQLKKIK